MNKTSLDPGSRTLDPVDNTRDLHEVSVAKISVCAKWMNLPDPKSLQPWIYKGQRPVVIGRNANMVDGLSLPRVRSLQIHLRSVWSLDPVDLRMLDPWIC